MEPHVLEQFLDFGKLKMSQRILQASDLFPMLMFEHTTAKNKQVFAGCSQHVYTAQTFGRFSLISLFCPGIPLRASQQV